MFKYKFVIPAPEAAANDKLQQFKTGFAANASAMGYDVSDIDAVMAAADEFSAALIARNNAEIALRNAVAVKDEKFEDGSAVIRSYVNRVLSNPDATVAMYTAMGIEPVSSTAGPVVPPIELSATANADGTCRLKWKRSTNAEGTTWQVEASTNGGAWQWLATSSRISWTDPNATPGVPRSYRVRAQRKGVVSPPSFEATIYSEESGISLEVAA